MSLTGAVIDVLVDSFLLFADSAVFMLAGFALAGVIKVYMPLGAVKRRFGARNFRSVFNAALMGVPLPLCSCSVIPSAVALRKSGAGKPATSAFLISTPESGVDSISVSFALLDPVLTVARPVSAFVTACVAGMMEIIFGTDSAPGGDMVEHPAECCSNRVCASTADNGGGAAQTVKFRRAMRFAFVDMVDDLGGWLVFGFVAGGAITALVPDRFFEAVFDGRFYTMPLMLVMGAPMYICATSSTPLAAAMIAKGLSPGSALVFLLAGPATNAGSLMILRRFMGARSVWIYLLSIAVCSISMGLAVDVFYEWSGIAPGSAVGQARDIVPMAVKLPATALLAGLLIFSMVTRRARRHGVCPTSARTR